MPKKRFFLNKRRILVLNRKYIFIILLECEVKVKRETRETLRNKVAAQMGVLLKNEHSLKVTRNTTNIEFLGEVVDSLISKVGNKFYLHTLNENLLEYHLSEISKTKVDKIIYDYLMKLSKQELKEEIEYNLELIESFKEENNVNILPLEFNYN